MTVKEILQNAYALSGQFISNPIGIRLINNAVHIIIHRYETALDTTTMEVTVEEGMYRLQDVVALKRITKDGKKFTNYKQDGNILYMEDGEYTFYVRPVPMPVEYEDDEPDINELYHPIIELYVASRIPRPFDRELEQEFYMLAEDIEYRLQRNRQKNINMPARVWR